jgi:hypothetical protein
MNGRSFDVDVTDNFLESLPSKLKLITCEGEKDDFLGQICVVGWFHEIAVDVVDSFAAHN